MGPCHSKHVQSVRSVVTDDLAAAEYDDCEPYVPMREGSRGKIVRVVDGDTVHIAFYNLDKLARISTRLRHIDTPELRSADPAEKSRALEARKKLTAKADSKMVGVQNVGLDRYGRLLCDVYLEGETQSLSDYMLSFPDLCKNYEGGAKCTSSTE